MTGPIKGNARRQPGEATNQNIKSDHSTKQDMIAAILRARSLNTFEAIREGDTCLHSTVSTLRCLGYVIHDQWEDVETRFGRTVRVKRYRVLRGPEVRV